MRFTILDFGLQLFRNVSEDSNIGGGVFQICIIMSSIHEIAGQARNDDMFQP